MNKWRPDWSTDSHMWHRFAAVGAMPGAAVVWMYSQDWPKAPPLFFAIWLQLLSGLSLFVGGYFYRQRLLERGKRPKRWPFLIREPSDE